MSMPSPLGIVKSSAFRLLRYLVLTAGLAAMMAMTMPALQAHWRGWFLVILWTCLGFFSADLVANSRMGEQAKNVRIYLLTSSGIIDLLAIVPVPLALLVGVSSNTAWLLASLWLLKLAPAAPGLSILGRVIEHEGRPLASVFVLFLIVLILSAVALYVLESGRQPEHFGSLPQSLWWAVTTLTTTGYGDAIPQTLPGRIIAGFVMICGLGMFGLWAGILATGFEAEHRRRDFIQNWSLVTSVPFLRNLEPRAIIELTRLLRRIDLPERSVVVRRGRPGDSMYFIASGGVEVRLDPEPIRLGAGSFFGEFALLDGGPRTATVVTTTASTLLTLDVSDFRTFTAQHPDLAKALEREAAHRRGANSEAPAPGA